MKIKKHVLLVGLMVCIAVIPMSLLGQPSRIIGGAQAEHANAIARAIIPANGYVMVGFTRSFGAGTPNTMNGLVVRTNPDGTPINAVIIGGSSDEEATSIARTSDNCYVVTGWARSYNTLKMNTDIFVVKFSSDLNAVRWAKIYHLSPNDLDHKATSIIEASSALNGGYVLTGSAYSPNSDTLRILVLRLDVNGNVTWVRTYGPANNLYNEGFGITEVRDKTAPNVQLAVVGRTALNKTTEGNAFIMRLNSSGSVMGTTVYNGRYDEYARSVVWDSFGTTPGITAAGWTKTIGNGWPTYANIWVARVKAIDGTVIWSNVYFWAAITGGIERDDKVFGDKSLIVTTGSAGRGFVLAGLTLSRGPNAGNAPNVLLLRLNLDGAIGWNGLATVHPSITAANNTDEAFGLVQSTAIPDLGLPGDGFAAAGWSNSFNPAASLANDNILLTTFGNDGKRPKGCAEQFRMESKSFTWTTQVFNSYTNAMNITDFKVGGCIVNSQAVCQK